MNIARLLTTLFFVFGIFATGQSQEVSILTWNIAHLGKTKSVTELEFIASVMKDYDVIAIQEVVARDPAGAQAVAKIANILNHSGSKWDYRVSDPTTGTSQQKERYAFIWKTAVAKLNSRPWLDKTLAPIVCREPYLARFKIGDHLILVANYHSIPHSKKPQWENEQVLQLPKLYPQDRIIIAGDYNINSFDNYWDQLNKYNLSLIPLKNKTTLRQACTNNNNFTYSNHSIDFFIYENSELNIIESSVIDYIQKCERLELARNISDHLPVFCIINLNK